MLTLLRNTVAALAVTVSLAGVAQAQVYLQVPAPRVEVIPAPHGPGYVWRPGYYQWAGGRYIWIGGMYVIRRPHYHTWISGHWGPYNRWIPAHWE